MNQVSTSKKKKPKTARGTKTREKLLNAAEKEFGDKGFHEGAISGITKRAGCALGTFYVYFDSKEEIFRALVAHMGHLTRSWIAQRVADAEDRLTAERKGILAFIEFVREHKNLYRVVSEAQFVAHDAFQDYYRVFAEAYETNLATAAERSEIRDGDHAVWSWAMIGMSVFLGMRFADWDESQPAEEIARSAWDLLANGLRPRE